MAEQELKKRARESVPDEMTREKLRRLLSSAGVLAKPIDVPKGAVPLSDEARERLGRLQPGARTTTEIIREDRGKS